jgi:8-oxo-dGTP diphosphatase
MSDDEVVRAAGGIVVRGEGDGREVVLVHRPKYDDWSLPKGKLYDGEPEEEAALREVLEETGLRCRLESHVGAVTYADRAGRPKVVRYWLMTPEGGGFEPGDEVDEIRWLRPGEAEAVMTYAHDRELLRAAVGVRTLPPVYLVRHAKAGTRQGWTAPDRERPLTRRGRRQAQRLVERFGGLEIARILSSPYVRCVQSVEPLAAARGVAIEPEPALAEGADLEEALAFVRGLRPEPVVLCGHGAEIEALVRALEASGTEVEGSRGIAKGSVWVLERLEDRVVSARYLPAPSA